MSNLVINNERDFSYGVAPVSHPDPFIISTPSCPPHYFGAGAAPVDGGFHIGFLSFQQLHHMRLNKLEFRWESHSLFVLHF